MAQDALPCATIAYKIVGTQEVYFDVYLPKSILEPVIPAVVYFHGGGLTVGTRKSWFPHWLYKRTIDLGLAFLVVDYQLLPASTGQDIINDIKDFFSYIRNPGTVFTIASLNAEGPEARYKIDPSRIAVAGSSAGGLCAYLAATVVEPKPKVLVSMYGMGGNFLTPYYFEAKEDVFVPGRELLDPEDFEEFLYPFSVPVTTESELRYHPNDHPTPGLPANPRMLLARLYVQLGAYLDYYTGEHELGLSERLRAKRQKMGALHLSDGARSQPEEWADSLIPQRHRVLFPHLNITSDWPAVFLIHGTEDYLVYINESRHLGKLLEAVGVPVILRSIEGKGHSFDYEAGAEDEFGWLFDEVQGFIKEKLCDNSN